MTSLEIYKNYNYKLKIINNYESLSEKKIPDSYKSIRDLIKDKKLLLNKINEQDKDIKSKNKKILMLEKELKKLKSDVFFEQSNV